LAVVPSITLGTLSCNAWLARPRRVPSRHILAPTRLRAFRGVPSDADLRTNLLVCHFIVASSAALLIISGAVFLIGPTDHLLPKFERPQEV
jgi:hypothetical protein